MKSQLTPMPAVPVGRQPGQALALDAAERGGAVEGLAAGGGGGGGHISVFISLYFSLSLSISRSLYISISLSLSLSLSCCLSLSISLSLYLHHSISLSLSLSFSPSLSPSLLQPSLKWKYIFKNLIKKCYISSSKKRRTPKTRAKKRVEPMRMRKCTETGISQLDFIMILWFFYGFSSCFFRI